MTPDDRNLFGCPPHTKDPPMDDSDDDLLANGLDEANLRILDAVFHNAGIVAAEDPSPPTPEELAEEAVLAEFIDRLIADG
jgi:hypothetical protein